MLANRTKETVIAHNVEYCLSPFSKAIGLMFSMDSNRTLIFTFEKEWRHSIHMFFVFFSIDILFLDKNKKVVELKENLKPFRIYTPKKKAMYIIELPANTIRNKGISIGDALDL